MNKGAWIWLIIFIPILFCCIYLWCDSFQSLRYNQSSSIDIFMNEIVREKNVSRMRINDISTDVKLVAVGDIMLSRMVNFQMEKNGDDYPFANVKDYLSNADILFGNLESPIAEGGKISLDGVVFRARPGIESSLKNIGFDVFSLANNHMGNQGFVGVDHTVSSLQKVGILTSGAGKNISNASAPAIIEKGGLRFAFLSYTDGSIIPDSYEATDNHAGVSYMDPEKLASDISEAKKNSDFVIVSMHGGNEYVYTPTEKQTAFAHKAIDEGAELIIGHHPHRIQDMEEYKGKYIFYSLGNFIFDQEWSRETKEGLIAEIYFNKNGVVDFNLLPVLISNYCQPEILRGSQAAEVLKKIKRP